MVLPCSLWLLSVCLLSWCCDARSLGPQDLQSELWQLTFVLLYQKGEILRTDNIETMYQMKKPGVYILLVETDKNIIEDVEKKVFLYDSSHVYKTLPKKPKLWRRDVTDQEISLANLIIIFRDHNARSIMLLGCRLEFPEDNALANPGPVETS